MAEQFRVLTVCTGNIHRSPLAAVLLQQWADWFLDEPDSPEVVVESAGIAAVVGAPMGEYSQRIVAALGADGSHHRGRLLSDDMVAGSGLVLTATAHQRDEIVARVPSALRRTFTIREAARAAQDAGVPPLSHTADGLRKRVSELASRRAHGSGNIVDPHGRSEDIFLQMAAEEVPALTHIARWVFDMPSAEAKAYSEAAEDAATMRSLIASAPKGRG